MGRRKIEIEIDASGMYASIDIGAAHYWLERSGRYWSLRTGNAFDDPIKTWSVTPKRETIDDILGNALSITLAAIEESKTCKVN